MQPALAYIALGSNLGDRAAHLRQAVDGLRATAGVDVRGVSTDFENPAVGGPPGAPSFLNAVAAVETILPPHELLETMLEIERSLGRVRRAKWEPRVIDLDLLLYGDQLIDEPGLTVPHPLMGERRFVLQPLAEIAPSLRHPKTGKTIAQMLKELPANS